LDHDEKKERHTKHYRIKRTDSGGCYISPKKVFDSLDDLVAYYSSKPLLILYWRLKQSHGFHLICRRSKWSL
jgi:hypothetical protein